MKSQEVRDDSSQLDSQFRNSFRGFGSHGQGRMFPSIFGGKDPFDDPFFTWPFGNLFGSGILSTDGPDKLQHTSKLKEPVIEELGDDNERESEENGEDDVTGAAWANRNPFVEHPEDQETDCGKEKSNSKGLTYKINHNKVEGTQPQMRSVSFKRVSYGGVNGTYYTATTTRKTGDDGLILEESKQADKTTGEATHRVSRGIHDKGHSIMRKLDSDGKVDNMQMLHNLNEDDIVGFEKAWKGNAIKHFHGLDGRLNFPGDLGASGSGHGRLADRGGPVHPFGEHFVRNGGMDHSYQAQSSRGRPKKTVVIPIN